MGAEDVRRVIERVFSVGKARGYLLTALMIPKVAFMFGTAASGVWEGTTQLGVWGKSHHN